MKRHLTASPLESGASSEEARARSVVNRTRPALNSSLRKQVASGAPALTLASASVWAHTLVLSGALNHRSAAELEAEIERLCERGVTAITLDLRELTSIDSVGVAVIVFRSRLCERLGCDFALVAGGPRVHGAFEQAGVTDLLTFREDHAEVAGTRLAASASGSRRFLDGFEQ
jgi:anti-anti-sigma factor